jgi:ubiquinone/menaquinone biosynthesis C-methylase UbiE
MNDNLKPIIRINELFHDFEGKEYQKKHADIFSDEVERWQNACKPIFSNHNSPYNILDIGTGTGFIPLTIAGYLSEKDTFICTDISQKMLDISKENLSAGNFKCRFEYLKINCEDIFLPDGKVNILTMNSVVHHIPDLERLFTQINKLILHGGIIIIGHEPNKSFYNTRFLLNLYLFVKTFSSFKELITAVARLTGLNDLLKKFPNKRKKNQIANEINAILKKEKLIDSDLSIEEIYKSVDFHSPTAGSKIDRKKGIDIEDIRDKYLKNFTVEYYETYNFISKMSTKNALMKYIYKRLSKYFKLKGANFFIVLRKGEDAD